jgi:hypothetical protein
MGGASATAEIIGQNGVVSKMLERLNGLHGPPVKVSIEATSAQIYTDV